MGRCRPGGIGTDGAPGLFDRGEQPKTLSEAGDPLERLARVIEFEMLRRELGQALSHSDQAKGRHPPYDAVLMYMVLVSQNLDTLSDDHPDLHQLDGRDRRDLRNR